MHLSDFSYLERLAHMLAISVYVVYMVWKVDRFNSFSWEKIRKFERKTMISVFVGSYYLLFMTYDFIAVGLKYKEGFSFNSKTKAITTKSVKLYDPRDHYLAVSVCGPLLNLWASFQTTGCFLLLSYYREVIEVSTKMSKVGKVNFMSSFENQLYTWFAFGSFAAYFVLGKVFSYNNDLEVVCPQILFSFQNVLLICLFVFISVRIHSLTKTMAERAGTTCKEFEARLRSVLRLNFVLILCIVLELALGLINVDILIMLFSRAPAAFYHDKFSTDVLTCIFSIGASLIIVPIVHILFPSRNRKGRRSSASVWPANASELESSGATASPRGGQSTPAAVWQAKNISESAGAELSNRNRENSAALLLEGDDNHQKNTWSLPSFHLPQVKIRRQKLSTIQVKEGKTRQHIRISESTKEDKRKSALNHTPDMEPPSNVAWELSDKQLASNNTSMGAGWAFEEKANCSAVNWEQSVESLESASTDFQGQGQTNYHRHPPFASLATNKDILEAAKLFSRQHCMPEVFYFLCEVVTYQNLCRHSSIDKQYFAFDSIMRRFILESAPDEINISDQLRKSIPHYREKESFLTHLPMLEERLCVFDKVYDEMQALFWSMLTFSTVVSTNDKSMQELLRFTEDYQLNV